MPHETKEQYIEFLKRKYSKSDILPKKYGSLEKFIEYRLPNWEAQRRNPSKGATATNRQRELLQLLERQAYKCALSGRPLTPDDCSLDHVTPVSRGGEHVIDNIQLVTRAINTAKHTMTNEEFISMCCDVAKASARLCSPRDSASIASFAPTQPSPER